MHAWLLMMILCSSPGSCEQFAIDEFDSAKQCEAAEIRANQKQADIRPDPGYDPTFKCQREGEKRVQRDHHLPPSIQQVAAR